MKNLIFNVIDKKKKNIIDTIKAKDSKEANKKIIQLYGKNNNLIVQKPKSCKNIHKNFELEFLL